jgi:glycosyltransferase involved in cell wall biosynthesis
LKISLIVTSIDRRYELERLFNSLIYFKEGNLEVIFVDQNITDENKALIGYYDNMINIRHIHVKKRLSLSAARNVGLNHATGELIGFPDDDCWYEKEFFPNLLNTFDKIKTDFICCSVYDPIEKKNYSNKFSEQDVVMINKTNAFRYTTSVGIFYKSNSLNMRLFDEELGLGAKWFGGEDLDFVLAMIKDKYEGYFINSLKVYHEIEKGTYNVEKTYKYNIGFGAVLKKSFSQYNNINGLFIFIEKTFKISLKALYYTIKNNKYEKENLVSILKGLTHGFLNY